MNAYLRDKVAETIFIYYLVKCQIHNIWLQFFFAIFHENSRLIDCYTGE